MKPQYEFYEIVRIKPGIPNASHLAGLEGAVLGRAQGDLEKWTYAIYVYSLAKVWSLSEEDLEPTGKMDKPESFYDGTSIRVRVDPVTGEGGIVDGGEFGDDRDPDRFG